MTLLDQWNQYDGIIKNREAEYLKEVTEKMFSGIIPKFVYQVWGIQGNVAEIEIKGLSYSNGKYFSYNKRPTRLMVNEIRMFAESNQEFTTDKVYLDYKRNYGTYSSSGAIKFKDLPDFIMTKEEAEAIAKPLSEKYAADEELIKAGTHTRCQRCQKTVPNSEVVNYTILSIATYGRGGKAMKFCSGTCAGHEQMAHEG